MKGGMMSLQIMLRDVLALVAKMSKTEGLAAHAATLQGPRTRGSTTDFGLEDLLGHEPPLVLHRRDMPGVLPGVAAYRLDLPAGYVGRLGAAPEASLTADQRKLVKVREGVHGEEKYLDVSPSAAHLPEVGFVTVLIGATPPGVALPDGGQVCVYTWHPGGPIPPEQAVKLHNG
jgi:hypothetical protein